LMPILPLWAVAAARGLDALAMSAIVRAHPTIAGAAATFAAFFVVVASANGIETGMQAANGENTVVGLLRLAAKKLETQPAPARGVASIAIGVLGYETDYRVIDMVGLADAHIAHREMPEMGSGVAGHEKFDSDYVLAQQPDYIAIKTPEDPLGYLVP